MECAYTKWETSRQEYREVEEELIDKFSKLATLEFVDGELNHIIFRQYYENGKQKSEHEWLDGKQNGRDLGWYENGKKHWEREFSAGKMIKEKRY